MDIRCHTAFNAPENHIRIDLYNSGFAQLDSDWTNHDTSGVMSHLYYMEEGQATLYGADWQLPLSPGHAYFLPVGLAWRWESLTPIRKLYFDLNVLLPMGANLFDGLKQVVVLPMEQSTIIHLREQYLSGRLEDWFGVQAALYTTFTDILAQHHPTAEVIAYSTAVADTLRYIQKHPSMELTLQALADRQYLSKTVLASRFKREVGLSVGKYIDGQVLLRCRIALEQNRLTIAQISRQYGFCDQFYFARFFKKHTGETPSRYRQRFISTP